MDGGTFDLRHVSFEGTNAPRVPRRTAALHPAIVRLHAHTGAAHPPDAGAADGFARWLLRAGGLNAGIYRTASLERRIPACLRALNVRSIAAAREILKAEPERLRAAVEALLIGVTGFFRDPAVFEDLRGTVLPQLSIRRGQLRVWSAACSSGPELYSLAILLAEAGLIDRTSLLGTDCRAEAIPVAREGFYTASEMQSVPGAFRAKYFHREDDGWRVDERLRRPVQWKVADLSAGAEEGPWDLILWRNLAIYLNPQPIARIVSGMADNLRAGGYLVLGRAERAPANTGLAAVSLHAYRKPRSTDDEA